MKIHVQKVDRERRRVRFASGLGMGEAGWMGELPEEGGEYHVELAIDERLVWGDSIVVVEPPGPHRIAEDGAGVTLDATLEAIDDEGAATLRLGPSLVLIETEGTPPAVGATVRVRLGDLALADTGI